jgi:hypothetical protein
MSLIGWTGTGVCIRPGCSAQVVLPDAVYAKVKRTGETFYCYMGHGQCYPGEDVEAQRHKEKEAMQRQLRNVQRDADAAENARVAAVKAKRKAERTCTWPTCEYVARSPKGLRQHMVDQHGAPWATAEVTADEVAQVLNGRDQTEVVK